MKPATAPAQTDEQSLVELRSVADPVAIPTKLCRDQHANNPDSESCWICDLPFDGAADVSSAVPGTIARLLLEDGTGIDLADDLVVGRSPIGEDPKDTLTVSGRQVSRCHMVLSVAGWELRIQDCDSTNGTFLTRRGEKGRRRVPVDQAVSLRIGDSIHFGSRQALVVQAR